MSVEQRGDFDPLRRLLVHFRLEFAVAAAAAFGLATVGLLLGRMLMWAALLLTTAALAGTGWWRPIAMRLSAERDRRRILRCAEDSGGALSKHLPRVRCRRRPSGELVTDLVLRSGTSRADVERLLPRLAVALRAFDCWLDETNQRSDRVRVGATFVDHLATESGFVPGPGTRTSRVSIDGIVLGRDRRGAEVRVHLLGRHLLLGGLPGSGKSSAMSLTIDQLLSDPATCVYCLDPKMVEFQSWAGRLARLAGPDLSEALPVVREVQALMNRRFEELAATGRRQVSAGDSLVVLVVDELPFYLAKSAGPGVVEFTESLRDVAARGRAAGVIIVASAQRPTVDAIPAAVRDMFEVRLAFRCSSPDASDAILGRGWASRGFDASKLVPGRPGLGYLLYEGAAPTAVRTFLPRRTDVPAAEGGDGR